MKTRLIKKSLIVEQADKLSELLDMCNNSFASYLGALHENVDDDNETEQILESCANILKLRTKLKAQKDVFDFVLNKNDNYLVDFDEYNI